MIRPGRRTQFTVSGLSPVTCQYDNDDRLTQIAQGSTTVGLAYDAASRRTGTTFPNVIVATYGYDDADQVISMGYDQGSTYVGAPAYAYDPAGRQVGKSGSLARMLMPASVTSAIYDAANRVTSCGSTALTYDNNGNLTTFGSSTCRNCISRIYSMGFFIGAKVVGDWFPSQPLRRERLHLQSLDSAQMFGVSRQQRQVMLEGGGPGQGIGQAHAVEEGERIDQLSGALWGHRREGLHLSEVSCWTPRVRTYALRQA